MRPTTKSSDSKKDPVEETSNPFSKRLSRIIVVIPDSYGVRNAIRLILSALKAALQAVRGFDVGISGCDTCIAFSTCSSPIIVAPEVQPYPITSKLNEAGSKAAAIGKSASILASISFVTSISLAIRE